MLSTDDQKKTYLGTLFLMLTGALILFAGHGKTLLSQPLGGAFFFLWILFWIIAISMRSKTLFSEDQKTRLLQTLVYAVIVLAACFGATWEYTHLSQPISRGGLFAWLGIGISLLSIVLLISSLWAARNRLETRNGSEKNPYLITSGPYRKVRHPGYLSLILYVLGIALSLSSLIAWAALVFTIGISLLRIRREEEKLSASLGEKFALYKARTPWILLPGLF